MGELLHRTFTPDLEVRSSAQGGDGRTIVGIAVPYDLPMRINSSLVEQFARGAFNAQIGAGGVPKNRIRFAREHVKLGGAVIGKTTLLRDDAAGLYGEWHVSNTPSGDETLELVRDGALTDLSVGFLEGQNRRLGGGLTERVTATLKEVASVVEGAYGEHAVVAAVRSAQPERTRAAEAAELVAGLPQFRGGGMWAVTQDHYETISTTLRAADIADLIEKANGRPNALSGSYRPGAGGVATIPVRGTITPRPIGGLFGLLFGGTNVEQLQRTIRAAVADESVSAIVLDIDSPGGRADGIPELAEEIRAARDRKPIVAVANGMAASAAYWIAAQATEVYVTPAGQVGSIGVFIAHEDWSKFDERLGVKTTLVHAGEHKVDGNPLEPLSDDARTDMQSKVDDIYGLFTAAVAKGRGVKQTAVRDGYGQGRTVLGRRAVDEGLADRIGTLQDATRRAGQLAAR